MLVGLIRSTLTQMEARLAAEGFVRIHRSRLVNLDRIKELRLLFKGESIVVLKSGVKLTASQDCLKQLQERDNELSENAEATARAVDRKSAAELARFKRLMIEG